MKISVVGLGKLGACMAAVYASKGHGVIGVDVNEQSVAAMNAGTAPVAEKDLETFIQNNKANITATTDVGIAVQDSEISFIIVPTPSDETGKFSTAYVEKACVSIGQALKSKSSYHLIVITSTVLPGDSVEKIIPVLERASGKKCGTDFGFCYSPEFIAIGTVIRDLLRPDFFLLGAFDARSGDMLEQFYATVSDNSAPVRRMSVPSAELTKISVNSYLTMKITFGNVLAELAEHIPGAHVDDITGAVGSDKRIGQAYLKGGLGYGGPCFPRDNRAFGVMATEWGVDVPFATATDTYNRSLIVKTVQKIKDVASMADPIGIIGISYKPGTNFSEESQGLLIAKELVEAGYKVHVFNPAGNDHAQKLLGDIVTYHASLASCATAGTVLFLTNSDAALAPLPGLLAQIEASKTIIDPWRQFMNVSFGPTVRYIPFGIGKKI